MYTTQHNIIIIMDHQQQQRTCCCCSIKQPAAHRSATTHQQRHNSDIRLSGFVFDKSETPGSSSSSSTTHNLICVITHNLTRSRAPGRLLLEIGARQTKRDAKKNHRRCRRLRHRVMYSTFPALLPHVESVWRLSLMNASVRSRMGTIERGGHLLIITCAQKRRFQQSRQNVCVCMYYPEE